MAYAAAECLNHEGKFDGNRWREDRRGGLKNPEKCGKKHGTNGK
jgi:hypothetical protein